MHIMIQAILGWPYVLVSCNIVPSNKYFNIGDFLSKICLPSGLKPRSSFFCLARPIIHALFPSHLNPVNRKYYIPSLQSSLLDLSSDLLSHTSSLNPQTMLQSSRQSLLRLLHRERQQALNAILSCQLDQIRLSS